MKRAATSPPPPGPVWVTISIGRVGLYPCAAAGAAAIAPRKRAKDAFTTSLPVIPPSSSLILFAAIQVRRSARHLDAAFLQNDARKFVLLLAGLAQLGAAL